MYGNTYHTTLTLLPENFPSILRRFIFQVYLQSAKLPRFIIIMFDFIKEELNRTVCVSQTEIYLAAEKK